MSNKHFLYKLLFILQILVTIFGDTSDITDSQSSDNNESVSSAQNSIKDVIGINMQEKNQPLIGQISGILPNLPAINSTDKLSRDKQINEKHIRTRVILHTDVDAMYNCTPSSVLSLLVLHSEFDNYFTCNQVLEIPHQNKLNATIRKQSRKQGEPTHTPLLTYESSVKMIFFKGNQLYYSTGIVEGDKCDGDTLTILHMGLVKKGSCSLRSGVTQIASDYAQLTVSGRCESTCFGDVNFNISPGLRN